MPAECVPECPLSDGLPARLCPLLDRLPGRLTKRRAAGPAGDKRMDEWVTADRMRSLAAFPGADAYSSGLLATHSLES